MADFLIRDMDPKLKRRLQESARAHGRSLSDEAKDIIREKLIEKPDQRKLGTEMFNMIRPEDRGDDLVFEYHGEMPKPPDFG
jgi:plasmid stability protein